MCGSLRSTSSHLFTAIRVGQLTLVRRWQGLRWQAAVWGGGWSGQVDFSGDKQGQAANNHTGARPWEGELPPEQ